MRTVVVRNGHPIAFGVGECICPPRPWEPDAGPGASIEKRLGTGDVGVSLACRPRDWEPDPGQLGAPVGVGFNIGNVFRGALRAVQGGIHSVVGVANTLRIPGVNLTTALLTGRNLGDALKQDVGNFASAAKLAKNTVSGNFAAVAQDLKNQASKLGIHLPAKNIQAAVQAAQGGADSTTVATTALGTNYADAWKVATHSGAIASSLPAPAGLSYRPGATASAVNPLTVAAQQNPLTAQALAATPVTVPVDKQALAAHLGVPTDHPAVASLPGGASYGPYPSAPTGTTAGVGNLDHGGGGHHSGGSHGGWHGGGRPGFRGRGWGGRGGGWGGGWGWGGPWWPYVVVAPSEVTCASWGDPISFPAELLSAARATLRDARGNPVAVRGSDGGLYLLSLDRGAPIGGPPGNLVTVRPCVAMTGVGDANDDVLKAMALDLLGSLQRTGAPQYATRSVKNFAQAWNAASADTQIDTSGKYTQETAAALNAALGALAPGSGAAPAAVL